MRHARCAALGSRVQYGVELDGTAGADAMTCAQSVEPAAREAREASGGRHVAATADQGFVEIIPRMAAHDVPEGHWLTVMRGAVQVATLWAIEHVQFNAIHWSAGGVTTGG